MRILCLLAALGTITTAFASFDLMLLPSSDGRIYRFDPANRVNLGSFGSGGNINATTVNPVNGEVVAIRDGNATIAYNPNTGAVNWATTAGGTGTWLSFNQAQNRYDVLSSNRYLDSIISNIYTFGPGLGVGFTTQNYIRYANGAGTAVGMDYSGSTVTVRRYAGGSSFQDQNTISFGSGAVITNLLLHNNETYFMSNVSGSSALYLLGNATTPTAYISSVALNGGSLTGFDNAARTYLVKSHTGFYAVGKDGTSANWRVNELISLGGASWYNAGGYATNVAYHAALPSIVLAPEPGTMIALGAGLVAILRRRKK